METRYGGVGRAMLKEFFPGPISEAEGRWWAEQGGGAKEGNASVAGNCKPKPICSLRGR